MHNLFATLVWAAADGAEETSGIDLLLPSDYNELWAGLIAFAIVFGVIWRLGIPAFNQLLENRQAAVKSELESAEAAKVEAQSLRNDYHDQLSGAREEASRIIERAREAGEAAKAEILSRADEEAAEIKARAQADVAGERERVAAQLKSDMATLSLDVAEKIVGESLDRESQQALVDRYIEQLDRNGDG